MSNDVFIDLEEFDLESDELGSGWDGEGSVEAGRYLLQVEDAEYGTSSNGNPMVTETLKVLANEDGSHTEEAGKTFRQWRVLTNKKGSRSRFKHYCQVLGVPMTGFKTSELIGRKYVATIRIETRTDVNDEGEEVEYRNPRVMGEARPSNTL